MNIPAALVAAAVAVQVGALSRWLVRHVGHRLGRLAGNLPSRRPPWSGDGLRQRLARIPIGRALRALPDEAAGWCLGGGALGAVLGMIGWTCLDLPFVFVPALAVLGGLAPVEWFRARARVRQRSILSDLAGVLDLLAVCADGGLSLGKAVELVAARAPGSLGDELRRTVQEMAAGRPAGPALQAMARRIDLPAVSLLVGALLRAEELGTPLTAVLRQQASAARAQKRHAFERSLATLPLKLTLCTLCFIFPTLFVLVVLPNLLWFIRARW